MKKPTILAIVAHPTDAIDVIGGTLAAHADRGDRVVTAVMNTAHHTIGMRLADQIAEGKARADKSTVDAAGKDYEQQVQAAFDILNCGELRFLDYYGEIMLVNPETIDKISVLIQELKPHVVITHHPLEGGLTYQHSAVGRMVLEAKYTVEGARENNLPPHHIGQIFFFLAAGETTSIDHQSADRFPQILIDVTEYTERKVRAMSMLSGQYYDDMMQSAKIVEAVSSTHAAIHHRVSYAEAFQAYCPQVSEHLPITQHSIETAEGDWKQGLKKLRFIAPYVKDAH